MMSSSLSSRASLPATSALVMAVSTIRSVEERSSSRALIAVVRSARRRSLRSLMAAIVAALPGEPPRRRPPCRARRRRRRRARRGRADGVRRWPRRAPTRCAGSTCRCCRPAARPLRVLHLSDLHLTPGQTRKQEWVRGLADLRARPGRRHRRQPRAPRRRSRSCSTRSARCSTCPACSSSAPTTTTRRRCATRCATCCPTTARGTPTPRSCPGADLRDGVRPAAGWADLTNARRRSRSAGVRIAFAGVDDPHLGYDRLDDVAGPADPDADLRLGVAHAPYLRVLDRFAADGYDAMLAGHTHGGQVCVPGFGALTTNCDLEPARAKGLHRHPAASRPGDPGSSWLHVSAGLGTSPYARIRFACRPEATLLTLVAGQTR